MPRNKHANILKENILRTFDRQPLHGKVTWAMLLADLELQENGEVVPLRASEDMPAPPAITRLGQAIEPPGYLSKKYREAVEQHFLKWLTLIHTDLVSGRRPCLFLSTLGSQPLYDALSMGLWKSEKHCLEDGWYPNRDVWADFNDYLRSEGLEADIVRVSPRMYDERAWMLVLKPISALLSGQEELRIVRIRLHSAVKGGPYCYHHADILAESADDAMEAAVERRVKNWREVDSFNPGQPKGFAFFEVLEDHLCPSQAVDVSAPVPREPGVLFKKTPDFIGDNGVRYPRYATRS